MEFYPIFARILLLGLDNIILPFMIESAKTINQSGPLELMKKMDHEQVVFCNDPKTGLRAIIAIHDTTLGPSLGGTRMWQYQSEYHALVDVLRLSRGMTFKSAISGLNLGGGKAVIIGDSKKDKSEALFRRFGQFVDSLGGKYITAEDVGINPNDMNWVNQETKHVAGLPHKSGDPSPVTAYGVYMGMKASAKFVYGSDKLEGKKVAVQGVGHVGQYLVDHLAKENADIYITDIYQPYLDEVTNKHKVTVINPDDIYDIDMDIYSPCALGATLNDNTLPKLKAQIIAGAANNQLKDEVKHGNQIKDLGKIYAPDFLINAGGVINCYSEVINGDQDEAMRLTENIYKTTLSILEKAEKENITSHRAALEIAQERLNNA